MDSTISAASMPAHPRSIAAIMDASPFGFAGRETAALYALFITSPPSPVRSASRRNGISSATGIPPFSTTTSSASSA